MNIATSLLFVTLVLTPALVISQLTIPHRALGYVYKTSKADRSSLVTLTAYMDLTCIDSKHAYPTLIKVADMLQGENFELVYRSFSLPFHRNSHTITEGLHVIAGYTKNSRVFPYITGIYDKLDDLVTAATRGKTDYQVLDIITPIATATTGIPADLFRKQISERSYDLLARLDFKYGCTRAVYGTPTFMVNDVVVDATPTWTVDQWMDVIKPLL